MVFGPSWTVHDPHSVSSHGIVTACSLRQAGSFEVAATGKTLLAEISSKARLPVWRQSYRRLASAPFRLGDGGPCSAVLCRSQSSPGQPNSSGQMTDDLDVCASTGSPNSFNAKTDVATDERIRLAVFYT